jgi:hypothetical protein
MAPWHKERYDAHLLGAAIYFDGFCFGSAEHDGIETLQHALGFNTTTATDYGNAMEMVALNLGTLRSCAVVLARLVRLLGANCTLHEDVSQDYTDVLFALAAGWIVVDPRTPPSASALYQMWLHGIYPKDRLGVLQLIRTVDGYSKKSHDVENSSRWKWCIGSVLMGRLIPFAGRNDLKLVSMAPVPTERQLAAMEVHCKGELWYAECSSILFDARKPAKYRPPNTNGGKVTNSAQQNAQVRCVSQTASVAKHIATRTLFATLAAGSLPPIDLLSNEQLELHDVVWLHEHLDHAALKRIALYWARGKLFTHELNVTANYMRQMRGEQSERLRSWQLANNAQPPRAIKPKKKKEKEDKEKKEKNKTQRTRQRPASTADKSAAGGPSQPKQRKRARATGHQKAPKEDRFLNDRVGADNEPEESDSPESESESESSAYSLEEESD